MKPIHTCTILFSLGILALAGCRAVPEAPASQQVIAAQDSNAPTLTVESLDDSIPLGDSFPVAIEITNASPNDALELEITDGGIVPSITKANVTTDSSGRAQVRLTARGTRPTLTALDVVAYGSSNTLMGTLYVNFEKPYVEGSELSVQGNKTVGEPLTIDEYYDTLPVATNEEEIAAFEENSDPPSAYVLDKVRFKKVDGKLEKSFDAVVLDAGTQDIDSPGIEQSQPSLTTQACTVKPTFVTLKTMVDGNSVYHIKGTRVRVDTKSGPVQVRYVGDYGRVDFNFGCNGYNIVSFEVDSWTTTGMYIHTGKDIAGRERLFTWKKNVATGSRLLDADSIRGTVVQTSDNVVLNRDSQRLFWRVNQVYDWERRSHSLYDTFPLDVYYPYTGVGGLSGVGRTHIPSAGAKIDALIFHEFGHEVYYRRMLGGAEYGRLHQEVTLYGRNVTYPACLDALGWDTWSTEGACAGMLEGFAIWFETVATRALKTRPDYRFEPEYRPVGRQYAESDWVPGRVAQFLMDLTDLHGSSGLLMNDSRDEPMSVDPVDLKNPDLRARYRDVAQFFHHGRITFNFRDVWENMFRPRLSAPELRSYCTLKKYNFLTKSKQNDGCW